MNLPLTWSFKTPNQKTERQIKKENMAGKCFQRVVVMRHGHRLDNFDQRWIATAERPWDPPLYGAGFDLAFHTGRDIRVNLAFPINRVFVSPFLRCVQTAGEVISALCSIDDDPNAKNSQGVAIDPSKLKVSIEYGLCEMLNREGIRIANAPKDGNFDFNVSKLEALLPAGTVDPTMKRVYDELPQWEESVVGARTRYEQIIKTLADKYPSENLLLVTHGEGVGVSVSSLLKDVTVYEVEYCAYSELRRPICIENESIATAGSFEVISHPGIKYYPSNPTTNGTTEDTI